MSFHVGPKSPFLGDRSAVVPTARILGGGSSVNMLMYSRGQRSDFDSWAAPGWSTDELLSFMKKVPVKFCLSRSLNILTDTKFRLKLTTETIQEAYMEQTGLYRSLGGLLQWPEPSINLWNLRRR